MEAILAQPDDESKMQPRLIPLKINGRFARYVTVAADSDTRSIEINTVHRVTLNGQPFSLPEMVVQQCPLAPIAAPPAPTTMARILETPSGTVNE